MDENPYANHGEYDAYDEPQRTSVLAIFSLILSLACCIPGLGVLGAGLGVGALMGIGGSRGRVGGKGLAMAGIIIGVLVSVAWVAGYFTARSTMNQILSSTETVVSSLDSGDFDTFRGVAVPPVSGMSDADLAAFVAAYQAELGAFRSAPDSLGDYIGRFSDPAIQQNMQGSQPPAQNAVPVPIEFENGATVIFLVGDPSTGNPMTPTDLIYFLPDGSTLTLSDFRSTTPAAGGGNAGADSDDDESEGDEGEPEPDDGP